jgi:AP-3 complex subunit beta
MLNTQLASALSSVGDAQFWEENISPSTIRQSLQEADPSNPSQTHTLLRGMKWLLASISKGRDVSDFYPHVVKLVGAVSLEVRKMVYMYLVQYADHDATTRELSLLSINAFQRGLADAEQLIRALALRVLTSIRIHDILQIQILGVQKSAKDRSPYVRKCAANALSKLNPRGDAEQKEMLLEIVKDLLDSDTCTMVLTSVIIAFTELCPDRLELLHGCFRKSCHLLTDMDEWGQVVVIDVMARYCRRFFREPVGWKEGTAERIDRERRVRRTVTGIANEISTSLQNTSNMTLKELTDDKDKASQAAAQGITLPPRGNGTRKVKRRVVKKGFYSDEEDASTEEEVYADTLTGPSLAVSSAMRERNILGVPGVHNNTNNNGTGTGMGNTTTLDANNEDEELAADHRLLLHSAMPLLKSRNAGVVLAVCSLQYYCGISSVKVRSAMGKALLRIHRDRREIQYVVLSSIRTLVAECPSAFAPFLNEFFVKAMDPPFTRLIKLDILISLALEPAAIEAVLEELRLYVRNGDVAFCRAAIRAVGRVTELARIVYDRHGVKSGNAVKERGESNRIALNCLHGLITLTQASDSSAVVGETVMVLQRIWQMLASDEYDKGTNSYRDSGDLMAVQDHKHVQDRVFRRILLLLLNTLSSRTQQEEEHNEQDNEEEEEKTKLEKLSVNLPPPATAAALWIVGEHLAPLISSSQPRGMLNTASHPKVRLELIRLLVRSFPDLDADEKEQGIHLASKFIVSKAAGASVSLSEEEGPLCEQLLAMGRVDVSPDVRDRARCESGVIQLAVGLQHDKDAMDDQPLQRRDISLQAAKRIFLGTKPASSSLPLTIETNSQDSNEGGNFRFGTLSSLVGHRARSAYLPLPPWAEKDSPDSLREPQTKDKGETANGGSNKGVERNKQGNKGEFYESSSSSDDDSSSSESSADRSGGGDSSSEDDSSSDDESSDDGSGSGDDSSEHGNEGVLLSMQTQPQRRQVMPEPKSNGSAAPQRPAVQVEDASDESSSSESASSGGDDQSSDDSSHDAPVSAGVGSLIAMGGHHAANASTLSSNGGGSSVSDDFKGLVLAPVVVSAHEEPQDPNVERDSSGWIPLVRPELASGLSVQVRYLRGLTKAREAQLMGLTAGKATLVCLQFRFENRKKDAGSVRRLRIMQRSSASSRSSIISPSKVVVPPEIDLLRAGQCTDAMVGIDFQSASDRDGSLLAKFDIKSASGSVPVEIKPCLADLLLPCKRSVGEFDEEIDKMHGFQRVESKVSLNFSADASLRAKLPEHLLRTAALNQVGKPGSWKKNDSLRLAGTLPASGDPVYIFVTCNESGQGKVVVCCDHALVVNSVMNVMKRALAELS